MGQKFKFRAWIPELKLMLYDITLYPDGMIGYPYEKFIKELKRVNTDFYIDWDYNCVRKKSGDEDKSDENVLNILTGEEWIWIENVEDIMLNITDDIFIYDIVSIYYNLKWINTICIYDDFNVVLKDDIGQKYQDILLGQCKDYRKKIGNIYQNPELMEKKA